MALAPLTCPLKLPLSTEPLTPLELEVDALLLRAIAMPERVPRSGRSLLSLACELADVGRELDRDPRR